LSSLRDPITIFHEPINIRAENVARIEAHAKSVGVSLRTEVFDPRESWQDYAINALRTIEKLWHELGVEKHLHFWPDKSLGSKWAVVRAREPGYREWLNHWWNREWPR
jgi:hypothetical protein